MAQDARQSNDIAKRGVRLHSLDGQIEHTRLNPVPNPDGPNEPTRHEMLDEHMKLMLWFTEQFDALRTILKPFLRTATA